MRRRIVAAVVTAMAIVGAGGASAQTRMTLEAGPLFPLGDLGDATNPSVYLGAQIEFQDVNALGQVAVLSYVLRGGYSPLVVDDAIKTALEAQGQSTSSWLLDAGAAIRAYAAELPLFFSLGVGYMRFEGPGGEGENGIDTSLGMGLTKTTKSIVVGVEFRGHLGILFDSDNLQFLTLTGSLGIPFL